MQTTTYSRLCDHEREEISIGLASGETQTSIALRLDRSMSTISREIRRHEGTTGYRAFSAGKVAQRSASSRRHGKRRLFKEAPLHTFVLSGLRERWSPREIVRRMEMTYPLDISMRISHEAIYQYVYVLPRVVWPPNFRHYCFLKPVMNELG